MRSVMVKDRQNLIDLAVQHYGSAAAVIDLCLDNDLELDAVIQPGTMINIQDEYPESAQPDYAAYLLQNQIIVVSINEQDEAAVLGTNNDEFIITNDNISISA
ncbi:hypothetical protein [Mucilaginibacter sp. 5C4]|uniref:hypothetical protein n=1 Tax=Mucilaginibacter sp. 5C4 TaxID=3048589 RepID=UPI002AC8A66E|nr:hypothetical protein [Mucilaginibacter sp. 5C4]MEB0302393.1 hypothetical protein [Mucilaginibacter sp. 5C4]WPX22959.1 hypothetical protein RHM67_16890 [Mucilaginibacter sp. 5C4]